MKYEAELNIIKRVKYPIKADSIGEAVEKAKTIREAIKLTQPEVYDVEIHDVEEKPDTEDKHE